ncbi:hypothetical protein [Xenorhabdus entomophaga]|uniref:hypothetical protein n=1 Tax=Xenorhabdus entomophaga TaxID=3136257 RepID=UPI0030F46EE1
MSIYLKGLNNNRYQFARSSVTQETKEKLIHMIKKCSGKHELLAEDIIELILVARNDPDGFRAVSKLLDNLKDAYDSMD